MDNYKQADVLVGRSLYRLAVIIRNACAKKLHICWLLPTRCSPSAYFRRYLASVTPQFLTAYQHIHSLCLSECHQPSMTEVARCTSCRSGASKSLLTCGPYNPKTACLHWERYRLNLLGHCCSTSVVVWALVKTRDKPT